MRELPHMRYGDGIVRKTQVRFGGYNHSKYAKDGEIYDMKNITQNIYPLMTTRDKRDICKVKAEKVLYRGNVYEFTSDGKLAVDRDLSLAIKTGDRIRVSATGDYEANSGEYIAKQYYDDKISLLVGEFTIKSENDTAVIQPYEITITLLQRAEYKDMQTSEAVEYSNAPRDETTTEYSLTENGYTKTIVKKSSRTVYRKRTTTTTRSITYLTGPSYIVHSNVSIKSEGTKLRITGIDNQWLAQDNKIVFDNNEYETIYIKSCDSVNAVSGHMISTYNNVSVAEGEYTVSLYRVNGVSSNPSAVFDKSVVYYEKDDVPTSYVSSALNDIITIIQEEASAEYENTTETTQKSYEFYEFEPEITAIGAGDKFYYVTADGDFYYNNEFIGRLTPGEKSFAETGAYIFILPDKAVFNINTKEMSVPWSDRMPQYYHKATGFKFEIEGAKITFSKSTYEMVEKMIVGNTYDVRVYTTSGNIKLTTATVQSNTGSVLTFDKEIDSVSNFDIKYITISVSVPDLAYVCGANNRVWGCDDKNIYCSAFGEPEKWNYFETGAAGVADNSWSIQPFDNAGDFTGCTTDRGMAVFFKENIIYKVYGSSPSNFTLETYNIPGVMRGSSKSIAKIKDDIYYLSNEGVMRFSGGVSENISQEFYQSLSEGVGGTDGVRYYLSCNTPEGQRLFVFNTKNNTWSIEDEEKAVDFAYFMRRLYMLNDKHELININPGEHSSPIELYQKEQEPYGIIEFGDYYCDSPDKKAVSKLYFRFSTESGGSVKIEINYDSEKNEGKRVWRSVKELKSGEKKSYTLPVIPRRADHFRLRISGEKFTLYSLSHEYYNGTAM